MLNHGNTNVTFEKVDACFRRCCIRSENWLATVETPKRVREKKLKIIIVPKYTITLHSLRYVRYFHLFINLLKKNNNKKKKIKLIVAFAACKVCRCGWMKGNTSGERTIVYDNDKTRRK